MSDLPLSDIRVIDLTVARAGPTAVRQLADWGADVIRVEPPLTEDVDSGINSNRHGSDFQNLHRNKRSLVLDLKSEDGRLVFYELVGTADIVVENFRAPVKERLGVDYDTLSAINPRLIYGSISGFGQDGPYAELGGLDQVAQGLGGLMSVTGLPGQGPVRVGVPISDLSAGVYLAMGLLVALHERERSGRGQWVRTSLLESMIAMLDFQASRWTMDHEVPGQAGNDHPTLIPMGTYPTSDGHINVGAPRGRLYRSFCEAIGAPELVDHPDYASVALRSENRDQLRETVTARLALKTSAEWIAVLNEAGVPCGPVNTIDQTFADPQVQHLEMEATVEHPTLGSLSIVRNAVSMTRTPHRLRSAAPEPGEHADEVLTELGYDAGRIADLRSRGII